MTGQYIFPQLITSNEAIKLFKYAGTQEMYIVKDLYDTYRAKKGTHPEPLWDTMSLLSFIYDTGRVNGIREERVKRKPKQHL